MGVKITKEFVDVAQPLLDNLKKDTGDAIRISWGLANWQKPGTVYLYIIPTTKRVYNKYKEKFEHFYSVLEEKGFVCCGPWEEYIKVVELKRKTFSFACVIQNMRVG